MIKYFVPLEHLLGNMTAFTESAWSPGRKKLFKGKDKHWGGGTLFAEKSEKKDKEKGKSNFGPTCTDCVRKK